MHAWKVIAAASCLLGLSLQPASADTYFYFRSNLSGGQQTGAPPPSPAAPGEFAILIDGDRVAVRGNSYSATTYAYGNSSAVAFAVVSGALPAGLVLNPSTGTIYGIPTTVGTSTAVVRGADTLTGKTATATLTLDTVDPFSISGNPAPIILSGTPYVADFTLAGGSQAYGFSIGAVPPGLSMTSGAISATLSGTPSQSGRYPIAVTGRESHGLVATYPFTLTVADPLAVVAGIPGNATVGTAFAGQMTPIGGAAPYVYSLAAGSLPSGLILTKTTGVVSGKPTIAGAKSGIRISVTDASGQSATSAAFGIDVAAKGTPQALSISGSPPSTATENAGYVGQFSAGGGEGTYSFGIADGTLPSGLTLNASSGLISGAPLAGSRGDYDGISVKVTDGGGANAVSQPFSIAVSPPSAKLAILGSPAQNAVVGVPFAAQFAGTGGSYAGYAYASTGNQLPPGLSIDPVSGILAGIPTTAGLYTGLRIRVADNAGHVATSNQFSINVREAPPLSISGNPATSVRQGDPYNAIWTAFNGTGYGYHFTSVGAALPSGLSLSDINGVSGLLSGTASVPGVYGGLRIQVEDSSGATALSPAFTLTVASNLVVAGSPSSIAKVGESYSAQFSANGGSGGYNFSISGNPLPAGLSLNSSTGTLSGVPSIAGGYGGLQVRVTDSSGATATTSAFVIVVDTGAAAYQPLTIGGTPGAKTLTIGAAYSASLKAAGGAGGYVFEMVGPLPEGLVLDSATGAISGFVAAPGAYPTVRVKVVDADGNSAVSQPFSIVILEELRVTADFPGSGRVGKSYSGGVVVEGGRPPYVFSADGLPDGLTIDPATGALEGTPSTAGNFAINVTVLDNYGQAKMASRNVEILPADDVPPSVLTLSWSPKTYWQTGSLMTTSVSAGGADGQPLTFSVTGNIPPGVMFDASSGALSGTVTTAGTYGPVTISATDGTRTATTPPVTFTVSDKAPLTISWNPPAAPIDVGVSFSLNVKATGGDSTKYVYSYSGSLPPGVSLYTSLGSVSGAPVDGGSYTLSVTVSDGVQTATTPSATIVVNPQLPLTASADAPIKTTAVAGTKYNQYFTGGGGSVAGYAWSVSPLSDPLPPGLVQQAYLATRYRLLTGAPTQPGVYPNIRLRLTDSYGHTVDTEPYTLTVTEPGPLSVAWQSPKPTLHVEDYVSQSAAAAGGWTSQYSYSLSGDLPPGTSFYDGRIYGYVRDPGVYGPFVVTVADGHNTASTEPFTLTVKDSELTVSYSGAVVGKSWTGRLSVLGGSGSNVYACSGDMPPGLALASNGVISGTPQQVGAWPLHCVATDSKGRTPSLDFTIHVAADTPTPKAPNPVPEGSVGVAYSMAFTTTGGRGPYRYASNGGTLPPGLSMDLDTGIVSGVPTAQGRYTIWVTVTDADGRVGLSTATSIPIYLEDVLSISGDITEDFILGKAPWQSRDPKNGQFSGTASGGSGAGYSWSLSGLTQQQISESGFGGGAWNAPSKAQVLGPFYVQVSDNAYNRGRKGPYTVTVYPKLTLQQDSPPNATVGEFYSYEVETSGGKPSVFCRVWSGSLPKGLAFEPGTCRISGLPTEASGSRFDGYEVVDASGYSVSQIWNWSATAPTPSSEVTARPANPLGDIDPTEWHPWSVVVPFNGTVVSAEIASGTLPNGLSLTVDGGQVVIGGTPFDNLGATSCGSGCYSINPTWVDVPLTIAVTADGGAVTNVAKTIRLWAYAPKLLSSSGGLKFATSTSTSNGCDGNCDVKSKLGVGSVPISLADGESITIGFTHRVSIDSVMFTVNNNLIASGSADYLIETSTDGTTWEPWEYDWYGYDRLFSAPGHVQLHRDAYYGGTSIFNTGNLVAQARMPDASFEFYNLPYDHTSNYRTWGRIVLFARLTRVGGDMPTLPVTNFVLGSVGAAWGGN